MSDSLLLRKVIRADIPFITSSWLESFRNAPMVRGVPNSIYFSYHHKILEELLPRSIVLVACNPADTDQIVGYICAEVFDNCLVVHYVYVKQPLRRLGVAKKLLDTLLESEKPAAVQYTAKTPSIFDFEKQLKEQRIIYNPYLLYATLPEGWDDGQEGR